MMLYLDASALVKRYVVEAGTEEVEQEIARADLVGTSILSRAEVVAAIGKAARVGVISRQEATGAARQFRTQWPSLFRLHVEESTVALADTLAWDHGLRGFDAVHLADALMWQDTVGEQLTFATFDRQLWKAGESMGLRIWPATL